MGKHTLHFGVNCRPTGHVVTVPDQNLSKHAPTANTMLFLRTSQPLSRTCYIHVFKVHTRVDINVNCGKLLGKRVNNVWVSTTYVNSSILQPTAVTWRLTLPLTAADTCVCQVTGSQPHIQTSADTSRSNEWRCASWRFALWRQDVCYWFCWEAFNVTGTSRRCQSASPAQADRCPRFVQSCLIHCTAS